MAEKVNWDEIGEEKAIAALNAGNTDLSLQEWAKKNKIEKGKDGKWAKKRSLFMSPEQMEQAYGKDNPETKAKMDLSASMADNLPGQGIGKAAGAVAQEAVDAHNEERPMSATNIVNGVHETEVPKATDVYNETNEEATDETSQEANNEDNETNDAGSSQGANNEEAAEQVIETVNKLPPEEQKRYTRSMGGIWDAFRNGEIDAGTAMYFTLDSISTMLKNNAKDLRNIAAAYSGGSYDDSEGKSSLWAQRRNAMFENELASEVESTGGPAGRKAKSEELDIDSKTLSNKIKEITSKYTEDQIKALLDALKTSTAYNELQKKLVQKQLDLSDLFSGKANKYLDEDKELRGLFYSLLASMSAQGGGGAITNTATSALEAVTNLIP